MHGHFPELALDTDRGVQAHPALSPGQEQSFPVGLRISGAQMESSLGEAFGRGLPAQSAMNPLVTSPFPPTPEPLVELSQTVGGIDHQTRFKVLLEGAKPAFDFP